jgi:hypothetical protein
MPSLQDLLAAKGAPAMPPQGQQAMPQQPMQGGNPLAQLAPQQQQPPPPPPAPTHAQTVAAVHYFGQIKQAMRPVLDDPNLGSKNIRPKLLDQFSKLIASKTLTLPEIMKAIKSLPDDPIQQKSFVENIYQANDKAQMLVLGHHAMGPQAQPGQEPEQWSPDNHQDQMAGLMQQYGGQR